VIGLIFLVVYAMYFAFGIHGFVMLLSMVDQVENPRRLVLLVLATPLLLIPAWFGLVATAIGSQTVDAYLISIGLGWPLWLLLGIYTLVAAILKYFDDELGRAFRYTVGICIPACMLFVHTNFELIRLALDVRVSH